MTTARQYADHEGDFKTWQDHPVPCARQFDGQVCGKPVKVRMWESSCGGYEDFNYRCEAGHMWWVDGIDS